MASSLEKRVYRDERTGKKRRWMTYRMAQKWLEVKGGKTDITIYVVVFLSLMMGGAFIAGAVESPGRPDNGRHRFRR